ncbi:winged helix-turn-helix transcriptional regulator [Undibacterium sp. TJN25]|uniref:winged helix-turn-helix transcriptional regulator n=1 Tax=Undibacterium sp. TJN25 TaxID=3413056 RepID=UPI003BEFD0ED
MSLPKAGAPVRGSRTGRPVMALLDILGRRWTLRVIWELRASTLSFRDLQGLCDEMSPTVLNQRLRELRDAEIVVLAQEGGYSLSKSGVELLEAMMPLQKWSDKWGKNLYQKKETEK